MNVLPFVVTLLMLLSIITYGQLQTFLSHRGIEGAAARYVKEQEIEEINKAQEKNYSLHKGNGPSTPKGPVKARKKLNLKYLLEERLRNDGSGKSAIIEGIFRRLIQHVYGKQPFMQELTQEDPIEKFIDLIKTADPSNEKKIKHLADLGAFKLENEKLQYAWANILNGKKPVDDQDSGCPSLKDFAEVYAIQPIRIFLASRQLLYAIYQDTDIVNEIIKERQSLYSAVSRKSNPMPDTEASRSFKELGEGKLPSDLNTTLFNFDVSTTNPSGYQ